MATSRNHNNRQEKAQSDLVFGLDDKPSPSVSLFAALQHVLASFIGIITPTLIVGGVLGLGEEVPYLVSMALIVSGVGTFIQARRIGPIGSGLLCLQGTSFAFLSAILAAGFIVKNKGGGPEEILSTIFGVCFVAAFVEIFLSRFIHKLRKIVTPIVTGTIITLIGLSLIKVAMTDIAGGFGASDLGHPDNLGLAALVLMTIVVFNRFQFQILRLSAVIAGLAVGFMVAWSMGKVDFSGLSSVALVAIPEPFKYGFNFELAAFIPIAVIFLITPLETAGDLTANSMVSKQPVSGPIYIERIKSGVLADGVNSAIAATFNSLPMTTFSQNNGVIQLTGVASRHVALFIAGILVVLGMFPMIGGVLQQMPKPVLGGATLIMFGTVSVAGIKILAEAGLNRRNILIAATAIGIGLGVGNVPEVLQAMPSAVKNIFGSPISLGAFTAIALNFFLPADDEEQPEEAAATDETKDTPSSDASEKSIA